ncbi:MAG TPA: energy-coupling factor ABC transporter permease, partial [Gemmataceae bacterium]|nr:energy-coupling factor ABC transporter permease [Gemmataceae bacterium]
AILVGLGLQAVLLGHGGFTTVGVNACVMALPALLAGWLFAGLKRVSWLRHRGARAAVVAAGVAALLLGLIFGAVVVATNPPARWAAADVGFAWRVISAPPVVACVAVVALAVAWTERRLDSAPEFALGLLVGVTTVLLTLALNALVLLWGGAEDWHGIVLVVFAAHLPIVLIEGVVLGFTVSFLARVKPEMLGSCEAGALWRDRPREASPAPNGEVVQPAAGPITVRPPALLLAVLCTLLTAGPARAHRLEAEAKVLPGGQVRVESWFDLTGDSPKGAKVEVLRLDGSTLTKGELSEQGVFVFRFDRPEALKVVVSAGAGHRKEFVISQAELERAGADRKSPLEGEPANPAVAPGVTPTPSADRSSRVTVKDLLVGIGFVLAAAAFVLSLRNARQLRELKRQRDTIRGPWRPAETPRPAAPPTGPGRG